MRRAMPYHLSLYLDLVRFAAALVVVLSHAWLVLFPRYPLHWPGPAAVIVFFVLSGFVIAYVTDRRDKNLGNYTLDRLSRLWSVALPALGFGMILGPYVSQSVFMPELANTDAAMRTAANAGFIAQLWFLDFAPPLNGPFWSLNYEAWFYAIFGAWTYLPRASRALVAILLSLVAGPKILILMPCWLLGVFLYRTMYRRQLSERTAVLLWICSLVAAALLIKSTVPTELHDIFQSHSPRAATLLAYSGSPLTDYTLALLVAVNFYATAHAFRFGRILLPFARPIRSMASFTLTTYLFHLPLLVLFWDVLHTTPWICLVALVGSIVVVGSLTEHRRRDLRTLLAVIAARLFAGLSSPAAGMEHPTTPEPVRLSEANLLKPELPQQGFDAATVRRPPVRRVVP
jgi:peptidoglycan/LPS O-acetylase OafA/YrhL